MLRFKSLGSGSSGNATLVEALGLIPFRLLIDCGLGIRQLSLRLGESGLMPEDIDAIARAIHRANAVFVIGLGEDGIPARAFAMKLSLLGILAVHHFDPALMAAGLSGAGKRDVLLVFSEQGQQATLTRMLQEFQPRIGHAISVTRHSANPLRAQADMTLLVSAHDERPHIAPLLYQAALQHLLDLIFVLLCDAREQRLAAVNTNLERMQEILSP